MKNLIILIAVALIFYGCKKTTTTATPKPSSYTVSYMMTDSLFAEHNPGVGIDTSYSFSISSLLSVTIDTPTHTIVYEGTTYALNKDTANVYSYFDGGYHQVTVTTDSIFVYHFWSNAASENHTAHLKGYKK